MKLTLTFDLSRAVLNVLEKISAGNVSLNTAEALVNWLIPKLVVDSYGAKLNRKNIRKLFFHAADMLSRVLRAELKGRFFHVTFDGVTCGGRHFLGVTLRFLVDGKIYEIFLGIIREFERQTGRLLASEVEKMLRRV